MFVTATGASTTTGSLIVHLSLSADGGTTYETGILSTKKVTMTPGAAGTFTVSDWFQIPGGYSLKVGAVENTSSGTWSAITVGVAYSRP